MSKLSYMEKLLDSAEVEWLTLGKVCHFKNGFAFKSSLFREVGLPIIRITNVDGKNINLSDVKYFNPEDYKENIASYKVSYGDILIAMSGATTGKIGFYANENVAYINQRVGKFLPQKEKINNRYLYHYLLSKIETIYLLAGGGAQPNLSSNALMDKMAIPIPCPENPEKSLKIQAEIVRILDTFTELTAELTAEPTAELTARKKQYNYYRDRLLSFDRQDRLPFLEKLFGGAEVAWLPLKETSEVRSGWGFPNAYQGKNEGVYPFYKVSDMNIVGNETMMDSANNYIDDEVVKKLGISPAPAGTIIFPKIGAAVATNKKRILLSPSAYDNNVMGLIPNDKVMSRFLFYWMQTINLSAIANDSGAVPSIRKSKMEEHLVPIPCPDDPEKSLKIQGEIVQILNKFDALTSSITEGLPREIELRKKQYHYYRDQLLNFPKNEKAAT